MHHNSLLSNLLEISIILVFFFLMHGINDVILLFKRTSVEIIKPFNDFLVLLGTVLVSLLYYVLALYIYHILCILSLYIVICECQVKLDKILDFTNCLQPL